MQQTMSGPSAYPPLNSIFADMYTWLYVMMYGEVVFTVMNSELGAMPMLTPIPE